MILSSSTSSLCTLSSHVVYAALCVYKKKVHCKTKTLLSIKQKECSCVLLLKLPSYFFLQLH